MSSQLQNVEKREIKKHTIKTTFLSSSVEKTRVVRDRPTNYSQHHRNEKYPNETFPREGVIFTHNTQGLSGKGRNLESLLDPLIEIMISNGLLN